MADYTDLQLRYTAPAQTAVLSFDGGKQSVVLAVTPVPAGPTGSVVATAEQLTEAVKTPGSYVVSAGTYVGNWTVSAAGVTVTCRDGVVLTAKDGSLPVVKVAANGLTNGLTWTGGSMNGAFNETCVVGSYTAKTAAEQPDGTVFRGVTMEPDPVKGGSRGFALHSRAVTVDGCKVLNYFRKGQEVQGVWICNGPGPYTVVNSYIEGAGENLLTGGASIMIPDCVPSDITVRGNTFYKPDRWRTDGSTVKNLFELKAARRVLVEDNVFDGCWKAAQAGNAIAFTARNADNQSPWVTVDEVVFRHNVVRHATQAYGVNILGTSNAAPTQQMTTCTIEDCLFEHCTGGVQVGSGVTEALTIRRNTFPAVTGTVLMFVDAKVKTALEMTDNVMMSGVYGVFLSGGPGKGEPSLKAACSTYTVVRNVIERSVYSSSGKPVIASIPWPAGNTVLAPNGIVYGQDFTYDGDGNGTIDAGWPGAGGLPQVSLPTAATLAAPAVVSEEDVEEAQDAAREAEVDRPVEGGE